MLGIFGYVNLFQFHLNHVDKIPMTPQEEKQIEEWNAELSDDIKITLFITEDKRSEELIKFCEDLTRIASSITFQ